MTLSPFNLTFRHRTLVAVCAAILSFSSFLNAQAQVSSSQELERRLKFEADAQQTGDPDIIEDTSKKVVSFALRQFANLRLSENANSAAAELASESLAFEEHTDTRFLMATALYRAGRFEESFREAKELTVKTPKSAEAWDLLGRAAIGNKDYRTGVEALEKRISMRPDMEASYTLAVALLHLKEIDKAAAIFKELVEKGGDPARMHIMAGRAYESVKQNDRAEAEYRAAIAANPKTSRGHYFLGLLILTRNDWEVTPEVKKEFLAEIAVNPEDFFGNYFMGSILSNEKNYDESDRYLKVASTAKPDFPEPYLYLGLNAYGAGQYAVAEAFLRKSIKLTGSEIERNNYQIRRAYFTLGRILIQQGGDKKQEGMQLVQKSKELEVKLLANSREQMLALKDATAGAPTTSTSAIQPEEPVSPVGAAAPLTKEGWAAAKMDAEQKMKALAVEQQLRKVLGNSYNNLGTASAQVKQFPLATAYFHDAERWDATTPGMMRNLGMAAFLSSNYGECVRAMRAAEQVRQLDPAAQSMLALALYSTNKFSEAAAAFEPIKDSIYDDQRMAYAYAVSLVKSGDKQRAMAVLEKLRAMNPPANVHVLIGQLYTEMGDSSSARACFDRARQLDPSINLPK